jgi:phosphohistidine phosphatase SixA
MPSFVRGLEILGNTVKSCIVKSLLILRHAKSSWKHPELNDHDRPLNKRGKNDAPRMGKLLQKEKLIPDVILSSTAIRASATAESVVKACGYKGEVTLNRSLYAAGPEAYLQLLSNFSWFCDSYFCVRAILLVSCGLSLSQTEPRVIPMSPQNIPILNTCK